jgi:type I restriction enzyme R subunit
MRLTCFDASSCPTLSLDKPMRNHTLMQTIARANRAFPGKHSGVIVDYANVFASLEKALVIYGTGGGGGNPVRDKAALAEAWRLAVEEGTLFCGSKGVDLASIEALPPGDFTRLQKIAEGVNVLIAPDALRRDFFRHERLVPMLYRAFNPDLAALVFVERAPCPSAIDDAIQATLNLHPANISGVMVDINVLLDR